MCALDRDVQRSNRGNSPNEICQPAVFANVTFWILIPVVHSLMCAKTVCDDLHMFKNRMQHLKEARRQGCFPVL